MELLLTRDQQDGMIGGVRFLLTAKARLSESEAEAVERYAMGTTILYEKPTAAPNPKSVMSLLKHRFLVPRIKVQDLVHGKTIEAKSILAIIAVEEELLRAAESFHRMLMTASTFGGETVHTFKGE